LVVPRHTRSAPHLLDIYHLKERRFVDRLESPKRLIGVSNGNLYFADSIASSSVTISTYRIDHAVDTIVVKDSALVSKILTSVVSSATGDGCSGKSGCCPTGNPFGHVQCSPEKLNVVDTMPAGPGRIARVVCNYALSPDSLFQFCHPKKNNMFVFIAPNDPIGLGLLDSLSSVLTGKRDWFMTTVVCYPAPPDLSLFFLNLQGDQILVNRCVSVPDSTLMLSDANMAPMALALTEKEQEVLSGYSGSPKHDRRKIQANAGISFEEFLKECGIIEQ